MESPDFNDPRLGIPVFSLYGEVRRPTGQSMHTFDVVLVDLQDLGCRIYTFITTLLYVLEAAAEHGKEVWVLDRPNPAGRPIEGQTLEAGWESFVGAGPMPMRHGMTLGEMGRWFIDHFSLDVDYRVIEMEGWRPDDSPGFGWPQDRVWINPSPNAANVNMARAYAGTVMLEGTTLSEGRGTTRPLELFGAPDIDPRDVIAEMDRIGPQWVAGCKLRDIYFQPTFHKHVHQLCSGVHIHAEGDAYRHDAFKPWRVQALAFKAIRNLQPDYDLWRDFPYEYVFDKLAIDVINGGPALREWVDDRAAEIAPVEHGARITHRPGQRHRLGARHAAQENRHGESGGLALRDAARGETADEVGNIGGGELLAITLAADDLLRDHEASISGGSFGWLSTR